MLTNNWERYYWGGGGGEKVEVCDFVTVMV